jgi:hypothetical protein
VNDDDQQPVRAGVVRLDLERLTYATVVVMATLAAYTGWDRLSFASAVLVVLSPVIAVGLAHAFSEALHEHAAHHRPLTRAEWLSVVRRQAPILLAAVPPLAVLTVGRATSLHLAATRPVEEATGMVTLIVLSAIAGQHAGLRGTRLVLAALAGGVVGLAVITLQIALKPH